MQRIIKVATFIFMMASHQNLAAQTIEKVSIQASGLTCSLCSNAIYKALLSIGYVEKVEADIKESKFEVSFKPLSKVNFDELKDKVEAAGFSVANMEAAYTLDQLSLKDEDHLRMDGKLFHFMNVGSQSVNGRIILKLLDKGFVPAKAYKKNARYTTMACYQTGHVGACCHQGEQALGERIYHVTL